MARRTVYGVNKRGDNQRGLDDSLQRGSLSMC